MELLATLSSLIHNLDTLKFLAVSLIVLVITKIVTQKSPSIPGPWGFPLIGHLPFLGKDPMNQFQRYRKQYGDVYKINLGVWPTVVISGFDTVRKVLSEQSDSFAAKPEFHSFKHLTRMRGLTFGYFNQRYLLLRKVGSSVVREFSGKQNNQMEEILQDEANRMASEFLKERGKPFNPYKAIMEATGSVIYQFCYGKGENIREDKDYVRFIQNHKAFKEIAKAGNPTDVLPWTRFFFRKRLQNFYKLTKEGKEAREKKINEISKTFDPKHLRHAVDGLISNAIKYELKDEPNEAGVMKADVLGITGDFFGAGFDTVATTLLWLFLYMAEYPEIQLKVQKEIEDNIGGSGIITTKHREAMPFTEATIYETMRLSGVVPLGLPHYTTEDVCVKGHTISKGTLVFFNHYSVGHDEQWGNASEFDPERFLDSEGKLLKDKTENVLAFSAGRRRCLGEVLARNELFLLFATLLLKCDIKKPENEEYDFEGIFSLTYSPKPYKIRVVSKEF
ncbi:cytochrome P450 1A1-like [Saccostrea cucullata]|uniref:cytochrome P450 1A1-like n=1 Tax=Saccostrea cuccullata TaxID=36930 RepID=UPI002ED48F34